MNQFIIVALIIAIAVSHLILLNRIRNLDNLLNLQGSELNAYVTLCKQQLNITKKLVDEHKSFLDMLEKKSCRKNNLSSLNCSSCDNSSSSSSSE